jgi:acyl-CoA synthetase (AMP-forming)/AMP-acid ligase II
LIELCQQRMANAKYSRRIEMMEESPKTATGKFLRRELRDKTRRQVDALRASESTRIFSNHERQGEAHASKTHHRATA